MPIHKKSSVFSTKIWLVFDNNVINFQHFDHETLFRLKKINTIVYTSFRLLQTRMNHPPWCISYRLVQRRLWLEQLCKVWSVCGEKLFKLDGLKDEYKAEIEQFQSKSEEILREIEALTPQTVIKCELETNNWSKN